MLIKDNGKIRNCTTNHAKMSIFRIAVEWYGYNKIIKDFPIKEAFEGFLILIQIPFWVILFPVLPLIHAWHTKRTAKQEMSKN